MGFKIMGAHMTSLASTPLDQLPEGTENLFHEAVQGSAQIGHRAQSQELVSIELVLQTPHAKVQGPVPG